MRNKWYMGCFLQQLQYLYISETRCLDGTGRTQLFISQMILLPEFDLNQGGGAS